MRNVFRHLTPTCWICQSRVFATNSAIFLSGGEGVLVDPGITSLEIGAIRDFIVRRRVKLRWLVLTHAHWDHLLGAACFPGVPIVAQQAYFDVLAAHTHHLQQQVVRWRVEQGIASDAPFALPRPDYTFEEQAVLSFGACRLQVIATSGHSPDHCAVYEPESGLLLAGDMLSDLEIPMVMETFAAYRSALRRLAALNVHILVPGHGTPTADATDIAGRFAQDQAYLGSVAACATQALSRAASLAETVTMCRPISFAQPDEYPNAHQWNIEQAYMEAGGRVSESDSPAGWEQDWL